MIEKVEFSESDVCGETLKPHRTCVDSTSVCPQQCPVTSADFILTLKFPPLTISPEILTSHLLWLLSQLRSGVTHHRDDTNQRKQPVKKKKTPDDCVRPDSRDWTLVSTLSLSPSSKSREQFPGTSWTKGLTHFYSTHMPARRGGSNRRLGARSEGLRQIYNSKLCSRIFFFQFYCHVVKHETQLDFFFYFGFLSCPSENVRC